MAIKACMKRDSLNESGSVEGSGKNFDDVRIELIKKDSNEWRDRS